MSPVQITSAALSPSLPHIQARTPQDLAVDRMRPPFPLWTAGYQIVHRTAHPHRPVVAMTNNLQAPTLPTFLYNKLLSPSTEMKQPTSSKEIIKGMFMVSRRRKLASNAVMRREDHIISAQQLKARMHMLQAPILTPLTAALVAGIWMAIAQANGEAQKRSVFHKTNITQAHHGSGILKRSHLLCRMGQGT